jgi:hypothetical protein
MDLPNGKALAVEDLKKFVKHSEHGFAKKASSAAAPSRAAPAAAS